jgi:hypothetical protein
MRNVQKRLIGFSLAVVAWSLVTATTASAELTDQAGAGYASICDQRSVPLPPPFGGSTMKWIKSGQLKGNPNGEPQSFNANAPVDIYYYQQTTAPTGLCMAAAKASSPVGAIDTDFFGVICQGTNGKTCFWDQASSFTWNPTTNSLVLPTTPIVITSKTASQIPNPPAWLGGKDLAPNETGVCSDCHAGSNAFNNHPGTATDLYGRGLVPKSFWFPTNWPDPIVPDFDSSIPGPWPQNPGPGRYTAAQFPGTQCLACHTQGGLVGAFPTVSSRLRNWCDVLLSPATTRINNLCPGTYNPFSGGDITCPNGAMPPSSDKGTSNTSGDAFPHTLLTTDCFAAPLGPGATCGTSSECGSLVCTSGHCAPPACAPFCQENATCAANSDCASGSCTSNVCDPCNGTCPGPTLQINCGGPTVATFVADKDFSGGAQKTRANTISLAGVTNPAPMTVYQSQRYASPYSYTLPGFAAGSSHLIRLHFAETNPLNNAAGKRKFSVAINGTTKISNLDLFATAGMNHAVVKEFTVAADSAGKYLLSFTASVDSATISGIEVF